jgi:RNA-directed DNA polymerase
LVRRGRNAQECAEKFRNEGNEAEAQRYIAIRRDIRKEILQTPASDPMDTEYRRLRYVRYADDFLVGIIGSKAEARQIMQDMTQFLADVLHLQVSAEKSGIRAGRDGVQFLGYDVYNYSANRVKSTLRNGRYFKRRTMRERIQLSVPYKKVRDFATSKRYGCINTMQSQPRRELLTNDDAEIAMAYNAELRGFANYYALAWNVKSKLNKLAFLWSGSLFKTLATRHQTSVSDIVNRFKVEPGQYVVRTQYEDTVVKTPVWRIAEMIRKPAVYSGIDNLPAMANLMNARSSLTARLAARICTACGGEGPFHIHHTNPLCTLKDGPNWRFKASIRNRKTVVLCIPCHRALHAGRADAKAATEQEVESRVH